jgi:hypothetical protein
MYISPHAQVGLSGKPTGGSESNNRATPETERAHVRDVATKSHGSRYPEALAAARLTTNDLGEISRSALSYALALPRLAVRGHVLTLK